jgi:hypothetical protein
MLRRRQRLKPRRLLDQRRRRKPRRTESLVRAVRAGLPKDDGRAKMVDR